MDDRIHKMKNSIYNKYNNDSKNCAGSVILKQAISEVSGLVVDAKNSYDASANKLADPSTSSKTLWSIL